MIIILHYFILTLVSWKQSLATTIVLLVIPHFDILSHFQIPPTSTSTSLPNVSFLSFVSPLRYFRNLFPSLGAPTGTYKLLLLSLLERVETSRNYPLWFDSFSTHKESPSTLLISFPLLRCRGIYLAVDFLCILLYKEDTGRSISFASSPVFCMYNLIHIEITFWFLYFRTCSILVFVPSNVWI